MAFLLTGDHEASIDAAVNATELRDGATAFFSTWVLRWSRMIAISKALAAVRGTLRESAVRTQERLARTRVPRLQKWTSGAETTKIQLERALLAIDVFPRCVVVLSIFEGLPLEDVATLLDENRQLVEKARAAGLQDLASNLASMQPQAPHAIIPPGFENLQHA
ncbi:MAG TPA: hypothetical protein VML19_16940 [Verrucomicrobiae bacterium]|nr:hypothetical protein [Verrucomicrobiae bacterium]